MSHRGLALALILAAFLAPLTASQAPAPYAPMAASVASIQGAAAVVSWVPGSEPADSYRVYGVASDGSKTLLDQNVTQLSAPVPAGFHAYAVSGVKLGIESEAITAFGSCIEVSIQPPAVGIACPTSSRGGIEAEANLPIAP